MNLYPSAAEMSYLKQVQQAAAVASHHPAAAYMPPSAAAAHSMLSHHHHPQMDLLHHPMSMNYPGKHPNIFTQSLNSNSPAPLICTKCHFRSGPFRSCEQTWGGRLFVWKTTPHLTRDVNALSSSHEAVRTWKTYLFTLPSTLVFTHDHNGVAPQNFP